MRNSNQVREAAKTESNQVVAETLIQMADTMDRLDVSELVAEGIVVRGFSLAEAVEEARKEDAFVATAKALKYI